MQTSWNLLLSAKIHENSSKTTKAVLSQKNELAMPLCQRHRLSNFML